MNDIPRRQIIDMQTPTERKIGIALMAVEALGADPRLTVAVQALAEAFNAVADWTDVQGSLVAPMAGVDASPGAKITIDRETAEQVINALKDYDDQLSSRVEQLKTSPLRVVSRTVKRNESVITCLEKMIVEAKTDNITGIGIAVVNAEGYTKTNFEGGENISTLLGAVCRLQKRLLDYQEGAS